MILTGFESLSGTGYADLLTGDGGDNILAGDQGGDTLVGGAGNDVLYGDGAIYPDTHGAGTSGPITLYEDVATLFGGPGYDDILEGGLGDDQLYGGGGNDTASYAHASGAVQVTLTGTGGFSSGDGHSSIFRIEELLRSRNERCRGSHDFRSGERRRQLRKC
jgi:Ca2+-binding RTX toxin-like protein